MTTKEPAAYRQRSMWSHFTRDRDGLPAAVAAAPRGYKHLEAYCLMLYACTECLHAEVMWNSRDGVTAFATSCPTCGSPALRHTDFRSDWCVPGHQPHFGQRVWVDLTKDRAVTIARSTLRPEERDNEELVQKIARNLYRDGAAPDIAICGYTWWPPGECR